MLHRCQTESVHRFFSTSFSQEAGSRDWRLAYLAAETGARFVRERIEQSPLDWLSVPHRIFGGRSGFQAVDDEASFNAGMMIHELSLSSDIDPNILALLPCNAWTELAVDSERELPNDHTRFGDMALFCSSLCADLERGQVQIFSAMMAVSETVVRARLRHRFGRYLEELAVVRRGFDSSEPLVCALVSDAMADILSHAELDPYGEIAAGLDFEVQQRFSD